MPSDDRPAPSKRLQQAREARGFKTVKEATDFFGWPYPSYAQHESGERGLSRSAGRYAKAYRVSEAWLLTGEGRGPTSKQGPVEVPLLSWVSAGDLLRDDVVDEILGTVRLDDLPPGDWIALRVQGDSMDRISPPESIILVNRGDKVLVPNACYVIEDQDGNATYKRYRPNPARFEPVSANKDLDAIFIENEPIIVGRVRRSILDM